jgi:hypothetical protein
VGGAAIDGAASRERNAALQATRYTHEKKKEKRQNRHETTHKINTKLHIEQRVKTRQNETQNYTEQTRQEETTKPKTIGKIKNQFENSTPHTPTFDHVLVPGLQSLADVNELHAGLDPRLRVLAHEAMHFGRAANRFVGVLVDLLELERQATSIGIQAENEGRKGKGLKEGNKTNNPQNQRKLKQRLKTKSKKSYPNPHRISLSSVSYLLLLGTRRSPQIGTLRIGTDLAHRVVAVGEQLRDRRHIAQLVGEEGYQWRRLHRFLGRLAWLRSRHGLSGLGWLLRLSIKQKKWRTK